MSRIISAFLDRTHKKLTHGRRRRIGKEGYGPVLVVDGPHAGRIGYFDDHDEDGAIVYFGDFFLTQGYYLISLEGLRQPTMRDMFDRWLPPFLSTKRYARFDENYAEGLASLLQTIDSNIHLR